MTFGSRWFVEEQELRAGGEGVDDFEAVLVAVGQRAAGHLAFGGNADSAI